VVVNDDVSGPRGAVEHRLRLSTDVPLMLVSPQFGVMYQGQTEFHPGDVVLMAVAALDPSIAVAGAIDIAWSATFGTLQAPLSPTDVDLQPTPWTSAARWTATDVPVDTESITITIRATSQSSGLSSTRHLELIPARTSVGSP